MKEILIFAGTTEGRRLSERLAGCKMAHTVCVATEYGEELLPSGELITVHRGRLDRAEMETFIRNGSFSAVVDATHPYAELVTDNIKLAAGACGLPYFRLQRECSAGDVSGELTFFSTNEACAKALEAIPGNIFLTIGSKELSKYCVLETVKQRLYVRVLPSIESMTVCMEQGIGGKQLIAMQGPFSKEMNMAVMRQYEIACLVTKESGRQGGYAEKLEAAKEMGIPVFVIGHPAEEDGYSFTELWETLGKIYPRLAKKEKTTWAQLTHGIPDAAFLRDKVPMTKEEVREISICKLRLQKESVVYDIGSGTGSVSVEIASLSEQIQVYAIEKKREAISLIEKNRQKFGLENITIVENDAPAGFEELQKSTHAFIGGSGGNMKEILTALYAKNPHMRVVINAISMETVCEIKELLTDYPLEKEEVVQVQVSRAKKAGRYHLMQGENPVWICAFQFCR